MRGETKDEFNPFLDINLERMIAAEIHKAMQSLIPTPKNLHSHQGPQQPPFLLSGHLSPLPPAGQGPQVKMQRTASWWNQQSL